MKNKLIFCMAVLIFSGLVFFASCPVCQAKSILSQMETVSGPTLLSPATDDIDLGAQSTLEFRWERTDTVSTDYYDFRLYKGRQTTEDTRIMKKNISTGEYPLKLDASLFEAGQVYSWCLIQVFTDGRKSDKSYARFTITNKTAQGGAKVKSVDVNKDGRPDVAYYHNGKHVTRVEADTDYNGKPDVTMEIKDGKFVKAEVDTNNDGKPEKKFTSQKEFNEWVNRERPEFKEQLSRPDWDVTLMKF